MWGRYTPTLFPGTPPPLSLYGTKSKRPFVPRKTPRILPGQTASENRVARNGELQRRGSPPGRAFKGLEVAQRYCRRESIGD